MSPAQQSDAVDIELQVAFGEDLTPDDVPKHGFNVDSHYCPTGPNTARLVVVTDLDHIDELVKATRVLLDGLLAAQRQEAARRN